MSRLTTALCRSSSRAMHGRPAITPPGTDGLLGGEAGLAGEDVDVDEDGDGEGWGVPASVLLSS
jgi:hypothetical protein